MSNEIKVADVDQVKELFTALKDKMNSLKIVDASHPIDFTSVLGTNVKYDDNSVGTYTDGAYTFTAQDNMTVMLLIVIDSLKDSTSWTSNPFNINISTTGSVIKQTIFNINGAGAQALSTSGKSSVYIQIIDLSKNDTITCNTASNTRTQPYKNIRYHVFKMNLPSISIAKVMHLAAYSNSNSNSPFTTSKTIDEDGLYLAYIGEGVTAYPNDAYLSTGIITVNGQSISDNYFGKISNKGSANVATIYLKKDDVVNFSSVTRGTYGSCTVFLGKINM